MVWHPSKYAELLAERIKQHGTTVWLVNTGWSGGGFETGQRMSLKYSRAIVDAILDGSLQNAPTLKDPVFGLEMITECPAVPNEVLQPKLTWSDPDAYDRAANRLAAMFVENFKKFEKNSPYQSRRILTHLENLFRTISESFEADRKKLTLQFCIQNH